MLDTYAFIKRIENIFEHYDINAATFADQIGVQRSSLSHLLSGRNNPSLDFILKIVATFPEVDLNWILNGKGSFPKVVENIKFDKSFNSNVSSENKTPLLLDKINPPVDLFSQNIIEQDLSPKIIEKIVVNGNNDDIDQIIFFYKNGDFKIYKPR